MTQLEVVFMSHYRFLSVDIIPALLYDRSTYYCIILYNSICYLFFTIVNVGCVYRSIFYQKLARNFTFPSVLWLRKMSGENRDELVADFTTVTGVDADRAKFYLEASGWNLDVGFCVIKCLQFCMFHQEKWNYALRA